MRTGDHDNKVADDYEQEFDVEELISHRLYDGKSLWHLQSLDHCHHSDWISSAMSQLSNRSLF